MTRPAIIVENLSKQYRIGGRTKGEYDTLRESIAGAVKAPFRRLRRAWNRRPTTDEESNGTFWALKDVSFEVQPGEVVGIIGRNGAGKSTLLKVLSRITEPTAGRALIHGRVGSLLEVGTGFHPELTGRENIYMNGSILGMSRREIDRKFDEIVDFSGIERFLETPVKRYSSGMYVRLAFAVAAHLEPEILVIDEVLAVGDAEFQKRCLGKMQDVAKGGRTVLFVSHNMTAVNALCSRCILIRKGASRFDGEPSHVIPNYLTDASSATDGVFDLSNHAARSAEMKPLIREVAIRAGRETRSAVRPDERITIKLTIESEDPINDARVAVAIEDSFGRRITTCATFFDNPPHLALPKRSIVGCELQSLRLGEGRYLLSVSVGTKHDGLLDSVDRAAWFEVQWNNNYGNGEPYHPVFGPVLTESSWRVECDIGEGIVNA